MSMLKGYRVEDAEHCLQLCSVDFEKKAYSTFFRDKKLVNVFPKNSLNCEDKTGDELEACNLAACMNLAIKASATELEQQINALIAHR